MRGDPPATSSLDIRIIKSTPHARGSTFEIVDSTRDFEVYPACAGIHLMIGSVSSNNIRLPRMRGDPP